MRDKIKKYFFSLPPHFEKKFLLECYQIAQKESDDTSTQTAAIIVNEKNEIISTGTNCFSKKVKKTEYRKKNKNKFLNHAERDAIFSAAKNGKKTKDQTMYMPWLPCLNCANAIIQSGIKNLITHEKFWELTEKNWEEELIEGLKILNEADIKVSTFREKLGIKILFRQKEVFV